MHTIAVAGMSKAGTAAILQKGFVANGTTGTTPTIALPAGAANQAALKIRFRSSANLALSEFASIDNVAIRGSRN